MDNLEKQLSRLPKARLSAKADANIRLALHRAIWQDKLMFLRIWLSPSPRLAVLASVLIFLVVSMSLPVYAYASSSVTSDHFLYPVKRTVEKIELGLSFTPESKVETLIKISNHRLDEAFVLSEEKNDEALELSLNEAIILNQRAQEELKNAGEAKGVKIEKIINENKENQINKLKNVAEKIGVEAGDSVLEEVAVTLDYLKGDDENQDDVQEKETGNNNSFPISEEKMEERESSDVEQPVNGRQNQGNGNSVEKGNYYKKPAQSTQNKSNLEADLEGVRKGVEELKNDLQKGELEQESVDTMVERLDDRIKKAEILIEEEELEDADMIIRSTEAIRNNAKHFIKIKGSSENNASVSDDSGKEEPNEIQENSGNSSGGNGRNGRR